MTRFAWCLFAGFCLGLALAACGGSTCSPSTCGGCCSAEGRCESGATADACGINGASCGRCGSGTVCQAGTCQAAGGGGGGAGGGATGGGATGGGGGGSTGGGGGTGGGAGGGSGGGAGGGSACRQISTFSSSTVLIADYWAFTQGVGHYNLVRFAQPGINNPDGLGIEIVYPNDVGPTAPFTQNITNAGYRTCSVCAVFYEDCTDPNTCARNYLARSGSVSISRADRAAAGRIIGSASTLHFEEWNLVADTPIPNGRCLDVTTLQPFNAGWNQDGGAPPP